MTIEHEDIRGYLQNLIFTKLSAFAELNNFEDLRDKTVVCNESYDGKTRKDIIIVIKYLSASNTNGIVDLPIQILVDVKSELQDIVFDVLQEIAYAHNQTISNILNANNEIVYKFKQFYNTPIVLSQFQNSGAYKSTTMTMDARFVVFTNIATSSDMFLEMTINEIVNGTATDVSYVDGSTGIVDFKNSILNTIFYIEHRFDGNVMNGKAIQENKPNSYNMTLTINYIFDSNSHIQQAIWKNISDIKKIYQLKYKAYKGSVTPVTDYQNFKCYMQSYTENVLVSDVTKVTVVFVSNGKV